MSSAAVVIGALRVNSFLTSHRSLACIKQCQFQQNSGVLAKNINIFDVDMASFWHQMLTGIASIFVYLLFMILLLFIIF